MPSLTVPLTDDQALALEAICKAEYRSPEDHVRMLIDEHIKDYNGPD